MSFGNDGNIYITDFSLDVVKVYDADSGDLVRTIGSSGTELGQFLGPAGITVSPNTGRIYVSDQYNYRIQVLSPEGQPLFAFGERGSALGQLREPIGVEVDEYENIYVADSQNSRVQAFDKDGNFLTSFGTPAAATPPALGSPPFGNPLDLTPGTFNWTAGLHYDDSKLYVGDFFQGRIQVLNITDAQPPDPSSTIPEPSALFGILAYGLSAFFVKGLKKQK